MVCPYHGILLSKKRNKILINEITCMELKGIMLSEKNAPLKWSHTIGPHLYKILKASK